jgi:uncharacterized RDD family membrane protein YckC
MNDQILDNELQLKQVNEPNNNIRWAGFWIRVLASLIDFLVYIPFVAANMYNLYVIKSLPLQLFITLVLMVYKPFMEYKYGATLGKMAVGVKVVNSEYNRISLTQSCIRYTPWMIGQIISIITTILLFQNAEFQLTTNMIAVGKLQTEIFPSYLNYIGSAILLISAIAIAFNDTKQGIHDMLAETYCIYK